VSCIHSVLVLISKRILFGFVKVGHRSYWLNVLFGWDLFEEV
jgi:hypothetical protein